MASKNLHTFAFGKASPIYAFGSGSIFFATLASTAIIQMLMPFKGYLHTLTFDNGREFAHHEKVSEALGISIFFAKPYHSWERGANENTNGLYRQYIPKGTDFQTLDKDILLIARLMLNTRPRKRLNFLSPIQEIYRIFASDFKLINIVNKVAFVT